MGDMGEAFNGMKEASKLKRESNRCQSSKLLKSKGMDFESKNSGAHLIVTHEGSVFDFWPGTGKWIERGTGVYKRGVFRLIKRLSQIKPNKEQSNDT